MIRLALLELLFVALVVAFPMGLADDANAVPVDAASALDGTLPLSSIPVSAKVSESGSIEASVDGPEGSTPIRIGFDSESATEGAAALENAPSSPLHVDSADVVRGAVGLALLVAFLAALKSGVLGSLFYPLFSRIQGSDLLDHDVRRRIHTAVLASPGITIKEITATAAVGWGTAIHHLQRLERGGLLVSQRHRQYRRFYDARAGIPRDVRDASAELIHPTSERLATEIAQHPGSAQNAVAQAVGISPALAHKYLGRLEGAQLLTRERDVKSVRYFPTTRLIEMLAVSSSTPLVTA